MKRTQEDAEKTRQSILDAGLKLISQNGYNNTTLNDISAAANITRGAIYWHFKNKEDLLVAIVNEIFAETTEKISLFFSEGNTLQEKLTNTVTKICLWYLEDASIREKRKITMQNIQVNNDTLLDKIFISIFPNEKRPEKKDFPRFMMNKLQETFHVSEMANMNYSKKLEYFILLTSFIEGMVWVIIRSPETLSPSTVKNIVKNFMDGFFHNFENYQEEK